MPCNTCGIRSEGRRMECVDNVEADKMMKLLCTIMRFSPELNNRILPATYIVLHGVEHHLVNHGKNLRKVKSTGGHIMKNVFLAFLGPQ